MRSVTHSWRDAMKTSDAIDEMFCPPRGSTLRLNMAEMILQYRFKLTEQADDIGVFQISKRHLHLGLAHSPDLTLIGKVCHV